MTTRTQLEETLAAQRARRNRIHLPAQHKRSRGLISALVVIVILVASGAVMFFAVNVTTPKADATTTVSPSPSASSSRSTSTSVPATPVAMKVCTDIPNGRLHVRFAAGDGSEVRGYLIEGETVQLAPAPDGKMLQGEQWLYIVSPIAGWVNAHYVCKQEK